MRENAYLRNDTFIEIVREALGTLYINLVIPSKSLLTDTVSCG